MSEENTRKRGHDDMEDDYDPSSSALPPHLMMGDNNGEIDDYNPEQPPHMIESQDQSNVSNIPNLEQHPQHHEYPQQQYQQPYERHKRQRRMKLSAEFERAYELCSNLQNLGDLNNEFRVLLSQSSETMSYFWNDYEFSENVIKFIGATIVELPHKSVLFSGLIMLSNAKNPKIGSEILKWFKERIDEVFLSLESGDDENDKEVMNLGKNWNRIILILRMFGLLVNIIEDFDNVIELVTELLNRSIQLSSDSGLAKLLHYEVLLSIPYCLVNDSTNEELKEKLKQTISISKDFTIPDSTDNGSFMPLNDTELCINYNDVLKSLPQITEEYLDDLSLFYDIKSIVDPLIKTVLTEKALTLEKENQSEDVEMGTELTIVKHELGKFAVPDITVFSKYENLNKFASIGDRLWNSPRYHLQIFKHEDFRKGLEFETLPDAKSYNSLILNNIMTNVLFNLEYNRVTVSKQFLNLQLYFNEKLFAKPNSSLDKLMIINDLNKGLDFDLITNLENSTDFEESIKHQMINSAKKIQYEFENGYKSTWKMEEIVIEAIINLIFKIPEVEIPLIYFETLLADTCGRDWTTVKRNQLHSNESLLFSKLVGDCFRYLFQNIYKFKFEILKKFINWFLLQISNFKFEWEWQEWIEEIERIGDSKIYNFKNYFVKNIIHKELLITNYKFIKNNTLPTEFKKFANLSLKNKEELIKFDSRFFGAEFASKYTIEPFENVGGEDETPAEEFNENIIETNTDTFKLFSNYLFNHDEHPYNDLCRDIYMNLENVDESVESLIELTDKLLNQLANDETGTVENGEEYLVTLIVESICLIGSRSFSVFEDSLNKVFGDKLNAIISRIDNNEKNQWIISAVLRIWNNEPRIGLLFIEKLLRFGTLNEKLIIESVWNCSESKILPLSEVYADEYLERMIDFADDEDGEDAMIKQVELITKYLELAVRKINEIGDFQLQYILHELNDDSSDEDWKLRALIGHVVTKLRKYPEVDANKVLDLIVDGDLKEYVQRSLA